MSDVIRWLRIEPRRPARVREHRHAPWLAVGAVCVGAFLGQLDASIVTVALPSIRSDLHVSLGAVEWVSLAYLLVLIATISAMGRLADRLGRKLLYGYGFALFTLASLGCGLAPSLAVLVGLRAIQGVGAAMLQANSVALIRTTVRGEWLTRAIGVQGAAQAIGLALGPAVGGLLVHAGGWRWVFLVNVPVGLVGLALGVLLLPRTRMWAPPGRFDWAGLAVLVPASGTLLLGLSLLGRDGPLAPLVAWLASAGALAVLFVTTERRAPSPLISLALFRVPSVAPAVGSGLLAYLVLFGVLLAVPLHVDSPLSAGLALSVLPATLGLVAVLSGALPRRMAPLGLAGLGIACAVIAAVPDNRGVLIGMLALAGASLGLFTPANNAVIAGAGAPEDAGMVSGLLNMTRGLGTSLGVAVAGSAYVHGGFATTMAVLAALAAAASLIAVRDRTERAVSLPGL